MKNQREATYPDWSASTPRVFSLPSSLVASFSGHVFVSSGKQTIKTMFVSGNIALEKIEEVGFLQLVILSVILLIVVNVYAAMCSVIEKNGNSTNLFIF